MRNLLRVTVIGVAVATVGCSGTPDVEEIPVGSEVQVTRDDGALVEGTLEARDAETVTVRVGSDDRQVARAEIADVRVVDETTPAGPPPKATFREVTVPAGTVLALVMRSGVDSGTSAVNDGFEATLAEAVVVNDAEAIPAGSIVNGHVAAAESAGRVSGRASLSLALDQVVAFDAAYSVSAQLDVVAEPTKADDAKTIGIGAAAGAGIGALLGGGKGAAIGGAVGGGAGTARVMTTAGDDVTIGEGAEVSIELREAIVVRVPVR
jgi:hypothetical protein